MRCRSMLKGAMWPLGVLKGAMWSLDALKGAMWPLDALKGAMWPLDVLKGAMLPQDVLKGTTWLVGLLLLAGMPPQLGQLRAKRRTLRAAPPRHSESRVLGLRLELGTAGADEAGNGGS